MKKMILSVLLALLAIGASAQTVNSIYKKYSGRPGVSSVYISPTMFNILKKIPTVSLQDTELDMVRIIQSFNGMYLVNINGESTFSKDLVKEVQGLMAKGKYELLMEVNEDGQEVQIFLVKQKKTITDFVMLVQDDDETVFISITGALSEEELNKAIASAMTQ